MGLVFISKLPTELIASFRATLEEVVDADLILHIRDINAPDSDIQKIDVLKVLEDLFDDHNTEYNLYEVHNKIDLLTEDKEQALDNSNKDDIVQISAKTGLNIESLLNKIDDFFDEQDTTIKLDLHVSEGEKLAWIYQNGKNVKVKNKGDRIIVSASFTHKKMKIFESIFA